jgi:membrane-associated phospholipid phosphatase
VTLQPVTERRPTATTPRRRRPHILGELLIVVLLVKVYDLIRSLAAVREAPAHRHGAEVLAIERLLHLDWELAANRWLTDHPPLALASVYWYQFAHIGVSLAALIWCYIAGPELYRPMRNALVITNVTGMTVFYLLPVMPPRLMPGGGYVDTIAAAGFSLDHGGQVPADQYAAMPSLHLAWAVWTACVAAALLAARRLHRWRALCYLYPTTTGVVVVVTANHWVLDVVAGVVVGLAAVAVAPALPPLPARFTGWPARVWQAVWPWRFAAPARPAGSAGQGSDDAAAQQHRQHEGARQQRHPHRDQPIPHHRTERDRGGDADRGEPGQHGDVERADAAG